jgi:hypothetical protein
MRQRRDKTRPLKPDDDDHRGIPRDAEGNPIFLILPPATRERYEQQIAQCEAAWRGGEPLAVAEATTWTYLYRQPIPEWLERAIVELAIGRRTKEQAKRYLEAGKRMARYMAVRDLKTGMPGHYDPIADVTWEEAFQLAAERLVGTSMAGSAETMKADYAKVKRDLKAKRSGKYFILKDWRYRNNGRPDPRGPTPAPELPPNKQPG